MNQDIILAALSSGFVSAILVKLLDILQEWRKQTEGEKLRKQKRKEETDDAYIAEKKAVYIQALKRLSQIRAGFDVTYDFPYDNKQVNEMIEEINKDASLLSAKIRLYASDEVYNVYWRLIQWSRYAFTRRSGQWRLMENGKEMFSIYTTLLARLMQEDLGYRDYDSNPEMVTCLECGREHDAYKKCECGMSWKETLNRISENLQNEWMAEQETNGDRQAKTQDSEQESEEIGDTP